MVSRIHVGYILIFYYVKSNFFIVMVLHYLYRAAVSALFSLVVLLITYCVVKSQFILLFEQIKKEEKKIMSKLRSTDDGRLIYETFHEGRKAFLGYNSLAKSSETVFVIGSRCPEEKY